MINKHRKEASNAGLYDCPRCWHMITERDLSICMECKSGDKFTPKKEASVLKDEFGYKK